MTVPLYKYTLGFIECKETDTILFLNREKPPHMGKWNGVGGKLEPGESSLECIIRETKEETGLVIDNYISRGVLRWFNKEEDLGGVYLFTGSVSKEVCNNYKTQSTREGILEFKKRQWVLHPQNVGVVDNIKMIYEEMEQANEHNVFVAQYDGLTFLKGYKLK
ncbi:nudix hydrolase superfamily protein [Yamadazyma tenuis]|uniref:Nudix hydrolase domain-containing protein n=1 Tax=Candida tenuis (strain ATCC 10573 / BCRC 21748 / CBS 615 / JCM 9827 / NBRC 10315 / NRRL Y-1498 / VKM Y-70) TaxID=590646 RepID=G3BFA9_CANTC|nr:uncharacterized protein CANTEDRAFT_99562 [Yamadazyma tenuis ATCC 10573]EGV60015.1 hypothetical protein CANTEDRAFT_99562 [Yamadazyma tenuis ATCC 10573]WEJ94758.1 nudix hydrolase superfamily protein [Yamadazyma tenuis]